MNNDTYRINSPISRENQPEQKSNTLTPHKKVNFSQTQVRPIQRDQSP